MPAEVNSEILAQDIASRDLLRFARQQDRQVLRRGSVGVGREWRLVRLFFIYSASNRTERDVARSGQRTKRNMTIQFMCVCSPVLGSTRLIMRRRSCWKKSPNTLNCAENTRKSKAWPKHNSGSNNRHGSACTGRLGGRPLRLIASSPLRPWHRAVSRPLWVPRTAQG